MVAGRVLLRRHWQRALRIREKVRFSEEAFHLVLAGGVGVIGGLVNRAFHWGISLSEKLFLRPEAGLAPTPEPLWQRGLTPAIGGLLAGLALYWGLRLAGRQ